MQSNLPQTEFGNECLRLVASTAANHAAALPAAKQAQLYQGLAILFRPFAPNEAEAAQKVTTALQSAEAAQMSFLDILIGR